MHLKDRYDGGSTLYQTDDEEGTTNQTIELFVNSLESLTPGQILKVSRPTAFAWDVAQQRASEAGLVLPNVAFFSGSRSNTDPLKFSTNKFAFFRNADRPEATILSTTRNELLAALATIHLRQHGKLHGDGLTKVSFGLLLAESDNLNNTDSPDEYIAQLREQFDIDVVGTLEVDGAGLAHERTLTFHDIERVVLNLKKEQS